MVLVPSTARTWVVLKAQLKHSYGTPLQSIEQMSKWVNLCTPSLLSCCHLPLPGSGLLLALPLAQHGPTAAPSPWKASHLPHISLPGGQLSSAPSVPWELSAQDLPGMSCSSKKTGQNTPDLTPPDSSLSPRISLQQQFSLCTSMSWLQTVLKNITKHNPKSSSVLTLGKVTS